MQELNTVYYHYIVPLGHLVVWLVVTVGTTAIIGVVLWLIKLSHMYQDERASRAETTKLVRDLMVTSGKTELVITQVLDAVKELKEYVRVDVHERIEKMSNKMLTLENKVTSLEKENAQLKSKHKKSA